MYNVRYNVIAFVVVLTLNLYAYGQNVQSFVTVDTQGEQIGQLDPDCVDTDENCGFWASIGECDKNPRWMKPNCRKSCNTCTLFNSDKVCDLSDPFCRASKIDTKVPKGSNPDGLAREVKLGQCSDRHDQCPVWTNQGECEHNPGWMIVNCPHSCNACHLLDPKVRCSRERLNMSTSPAYAPGGMELMFSGIKEKYDALYGVDVISTSPWVVTFDHFLTNEEADALISTQKKWERSTDSGKMNEFGEVGRVLSTGRTSSNSWCRHECEQNEYVQSLTRKIEEVVNISSVNYESFQVLRCKYTSTFAC